MYTLPSAPRQGVLGPAISVWHGLLWLGLVCLLLTWIF